MQLLPYLGLVIAGFYAGKTSATPLPAAAAPNTTSKCFAGGGRTLLWDWRLTRDAQAGDSVLQATAQLVVNNSLSTAITSITNWEVWRPSELPSTIPFRPTVRTPAQLDDPKTWEQLLATVRQERAQDRTGNGVVVHFYSEPERQGIAVETAVADWRRKMLPLRAAHDDVHLASPACAGNAAGTAWLDAFLAALKNDVDEDERPDYLALHYYAANSEAATAGAVDAEVEQAKAYFLERHTTHNRDIIVSELASTSRDSDAVAKFTKGIGDWLEMQQNWVLEYGIFGVSREPVDSFVSPAAQLLDSAGQWTALGRWFVGI